jgi:hypothetical protein
MYGIFDSLSDFIVTPLLRWIFMGLAFFITILQFLNEPQRFSFKKAFSGLSYKWHLYIIAVLGCITFTLMLLGMWITIPFTDKLPDFWYIYVFVLYIAIITQITVDTKQIKDDGSFNPPPAYILPQKYRVLLSYATVIIDVIILLQMYIYFNIADKEKKTLLSRYFLERFGGWYEGNKLDFLFEWSGVIDVLFKVYILYLQKNFRGCDYGLPPSWNA